MEQDDQRLRILICIGGGPEAYTGLSFATRLSHYGCADIALLYVRPLDSGLKSGGMEVRVARENLLDWGLELPGMKHLKTARDILIDLGEIERDKEEDWHHRDISGDPAGEYIREYKSPCGGTISLHMRTASDVTTAVVDETKLHNADLVIVGASPHPVEGIRKFLAPKQLALLIASHTDRTVIVARQLEPGHGHLVCVQDTERCREMILKAIRYSKACNCDTSLLSVAPTEPDIDEAQRAIDYATEQFRANGIEPKEALIEVGNPADIISEMGYDYSLVVMAESEKPWFAKAFSVVHEVAARSRNSVMIVK